MANESVIAFLRQWPSGKLVPPAGVRVLGLLGRNGDPYGFEEVFAALVAATEPPKVETKPNYGLPLQWRQRGEANAAA